MTFENKADNNVQKPITIGTKHLWAYVLKNIKIAIKIAPLFLSLHRKITGLVLDFLDNDVSYSVV